MARILFLPAILIILTMGILLVLSLVKMLRRSKSHDIKLTLPHTYQGEMEDLLSTMHLSLRNLGSVQYQSEIYINYKKISVSINSNTGHCKMISPSETLEIRREGESLRINTNKNEIKIPRENPWLDIWCNVGTVEENIQLFLQNGMKVITRDVGTYQQRKYIEVMAVSPMLSTQANQAIETCTPFLGLVYGKNVMEPGVNIRNFVMRILVNSLTSLPDFIETKYNIFRGDEFVCDYLQNSKLRY